MKKVSILIIICFAFLLAGCGNSVLQNMSDDQMDIVGERAAITLLKYDANSKSRLVDLSLIEETETPAAERVPVEPMPQPETQPKPEPEKPDADIVDRTNQQNENTVSSLEAFFELPEGVVLEYSNYELLDSYQGEDNDYFSLEATEGKKLLVAHFVLRNLSPEQRNINIFEQTNSYRVTMNENYTRATLTTMLNNDLSTFIGEIASGGEKDVVLLAEIEEEQAIKIDNVRLELKNEQKKYTIQLN